MNSDDIRVLKDIRDELRETLDASVSPPAEITDHESLEDISFKLQRALNTLEHQIFEH